jgi:hypothetical protein
MVLLHFTRQLSPCPQLLILVRGLFAIAILEICGARLIGLTASGTASRRAEDLMAEVMDCPRPLADPTNMCCLGVALTPCSMHRSQLTSWASVTV